MQDSVEDKILEDRENREMKHKSLEDVIDTVSRREGSHIRTRDKEALAQAIRDYALSEWVVEEKTRLRCPTGHYRGGWNKARAEQIRKIKGGE